MLLAVRRASYLLCNIPTRELISLDKTHEVHWILSFYLPARIWKTTYLDHFSVRPKWLCGKVNSMVSTNKSQTSQPKDWDLAMKQNEVPPTEEIGTD